MSYKKPKPNRSIAFPFWILWRLVSGHSEAAWGYHLLSESLSETRTPQLKDRRGDRHPDQGGEREKEKENRGQGNKDRTPAELPRNAQTNS